MIGIYAHVSTEAQQDFAEQQTAEGLNWAKQRNEDAAVYIDKGGRQELEHLLSDCEAGKIQGVWVERLSVLSRDLESQMKIRAKLESAKVLLHISDGR